MMQAPPIKYDVTVVKGGWDQVSPTLSLKSGVARDCLNYEVAPTGGVARIGGYERFDGQAKPSSAVHSLVQVVAFTNTPTAGQTLTGGTSGATAVIVAVGANYMAVTKKTGTFVAAETVSVGATAIGTTVALSASITIKQSAQYDKLAADQYRADILEVPGSGSVLGVQLFNDILYAFRANAGGTAVDLYKSSAAGWVQVPYFYEVSFTAGTTEPADGATLTQGANTATIKRVVAQTGAWTGTAAGRFIITAPAPGNFAAGAATATGGTTITLSGIQTAITMAVGGKFEFDQANFFGQASGLRLYGADGVNRLFEFDGTTLVPIVTGTTPDTPKHVAVFKNHLFCSISSSALHSGVGVPYRFNAAAGGSEIATGDTVTGFLVQSGAQTTGALAIFGRSNVFMLYGTGLTTWNFVLHSSGTGALDYTTQTMAQSYFLDDRGVTSLQASQVYGNFEQATLTNNINTFIKAKRSSVAASGLSRERSQYRLFFNDGYALYATIVNGKYLGAMQIQFDHIPYCACTGEMANGDEALYFGGTDGYVYQLDKGSSLDGNTINALITFNWNSAGSPRTTKRYRRGSVEMQGTGYAEIQFSYSLGYGSTEEMQPNAATYSTNFSATNWDDPDVTWDTTFFWDGVTLSPTEIEMEGTAENVRITISSSSDYMYPHTINSIITHYTPRRGLR